MKTIRQGALDVGTHCHIDVQRHDVFVGILAQLFSEALEETSHFRGYVNLARLRVRVSKRIVRMRAER